jgi:predicted ATPase
VAAARVLGPRFADGVWLVQFSPLADPGLVPTDVASAGGLELGGEASVQNVAQALAGRRLLLVLDTCEHVIEVAASMAEAALRASPELRILATTREPLKAEGEWVYWCHRWRCRQQMSSEKIFQIRLDPAVPSERGGQPRFAPDGTLVQLVAAIAGGSDGIPLANRAGRSAPPRARRRAACRPSRRPFSAADRRTPDGAAQAPDSCGRRSTGVTTYSPSLSA